MRIAAWPLDRWDLDTLTLAAFYFQPALEVTRAEWEATRASEKTAAQRPNPTLNVTPGYNTTTATPSPWIPLGYLDIPIETAGKRAYRREQAANLATAARLKLAVAAWQTRSELRSALVDYVAAQKRSALLVKQMDSQNRAVQLLEARVQAGLAASSEVVPFRIAAQKTHLDLTEARRTQAGARTRIAGVIGVPARALDNAQFDCDLSTGLTCIDALHSAELRRAALQSRSDILAALAEYAAAESALGLEIARQYPDVHLQPGYQYDQGDNKWTLGLTIDLPVLHQNQGPIAEAQAKRLAAAARVTEIQTKVLNQIDRAAAEFAATEAAATTLRSLADAESRRRDAVLAQANAGVADQLDVTNAETEFLSAQAIQLESEVRLQTALGMLEDAVQRPLDLITAIYKTPAHAIP
jgi:outer membrane protein, heavy metal efflux system